MKTGRAQQIVGFDPLIKLDAFPKLRLETVRYGIAVSVIVLTTVICFFSKTIVNFPYLLSFMAAVGLCSLLGIGPSIVALLLAIVLSDFFLIPPIFSISFDHVTILAATHYVLAVLVVIWAVRASFRTGLDQKVRAILLHLLERLASASELEGAQPARFLGRLDDSAGGEIFGWAIDSIEPSVPPKLTVHVEGRPVGEISPVIYRPDVGSHSFCFDLSKAHLPLTAASVDVRLPNGRAIANSPLNVTIPAATPARHSEAILFMHIPKTAGTAFREVIVPDYKQSEVAYIYPDPPGFLVDNLALLPLEQRRRFRLVIGHFQYGIHQFFPHEWTYVTVVREPVARVISEFRYQRGRADGDNSSKRASPVYLVELLERAENIALDNLVVRCFSGVSERDFPPGHIDRGAFELAVHNLKQSFFFVGHQERADEAYSILQQRFHWSPRPLPVVNRAGDLEIQKFDSVRSTIQHFNRWDCRLYSEICKLFP